MKAHRWRPRATCCCYRDRRKRCRCACPMLFDFTNDSWKSRLLIVLALCYIFSLSANMVLLFLGFQVMSVPVDARYNMTVVHLVCGDGLLTPSELPPLPQNAVAQPPLSPPEAENIAPPDSNLHHSPNGIVAIPPSVARWMPVLYSVVEQFIRAIFVLTLCLVSIPLFVGVSSFQRIEVTMFSTAVVVIIFGVDVISIFLPVYNDTMLIRDMFDLVTGPFSHCFIPLLVPTIFSRLASFGLELAVLVLFFIQIHNDRKYGSTKFSDSKKLTDAYALVERLVNPIREPLAQPKSPLDCCSKPRLRRLKEKSPIDEQKNVILEDINGTEQNVDLEDEADDLEDAAAPLIRAQSLSNKLVALNAKIFTKCCQKTAKATLKTCNPWRWIIAATTPDPPRPHARFELDSDFRYPTRLLAAHYVTLVIVGMIALTAGGTFIRLSYRIDTIVELLSTVIVPGMIVSRDTLILLETEIFYGGISVCLFAYLVHCFNLWRSLVNFKNTIFSMRQGRWPFPRKSVNLFDASPYVGHQIIHSAIGVVFSIFLGVVLIVAGHLLVQVPSIRNYVSNFIIVSGSIWFAQWASQSILRVAFTKWRGRLLRFRPLYQFVDMLFFFISTLSGVFSGIARLLMIFAFTILQVSRLDRDYHLPVALDGAHGSYKAVLAADHTFNNPVNLVFMDLLWKSIEDKPVYEPESEAQRKSRQARLRWRLIIFLAKNQHLCRFRKHRLRGELRADEARDLSE